MNRTLIISVVLIAAASCKRHETPAAQPTPAAGQMAPNGAGMAAQPMGAMGQGAMAAPAAGGGSCAQYAQCCSALAAMPGMQSMSASCAQVAQLSALGPQGEQACSTAMMGLRQAVGMMPNAPPACAGGGTTGAAAMGAVPGMMAPGGNMMAPGGNMMAPGAGAMAAPAGGGGSCAQYAQCCNAIAAMPNMASLGPSCAQVQTLSTLGAQGEQACAMALSGLRQAAAMMPNAPPACTGGGAAAAAPAGGGAAAASAVAVGATAQGALAAGDQQTDHGVADDYAINLTAGQPVTIIVRGGPTPSDPNSTVDVQATLLCGGTQVAFDDDSAGNNNSRIVYTPTATGACTVRVTGFGGATGPYTLQTYAGALPNQT